MSTSASAPVAASSIGFRRWGFAALQFATRRRIGLTTLIFGALIACDVLLWQTRPCNLFDWTDGTTIVGELLILFGLLIRAWAAGTLRKSEQIITSGPYRYVRNPLYIGSFLLMLGFCLLLRDWLAIWIVLGPILALYLNKVRQEERFLALSFPEDWAAYESRTPRFVPDLTSWPSLADFSFRQWTFNREYQALLASIAGLIMLFCWQRAMS
jgi:protein-S-isoprenylcysteine O-methyltransferase Ste14